MNDLGMVGGSGLVFTPTIGVTPEAHFRVDASRISFLRSGDGGVNSIGITSGLSQNMEFTAKFQSAQAGESIAPSFIGFGGKFVLPITLPFEFRTAIWAEKVSTSNPNTAPIFSSSIDREGSFVIRHSLKNLTVISFSALLTPITQKSFQPDATLPTLSPEC